MQVEATRATQIRISGDGPGRAEADGNRTRQARVARFAGFEDREGHQSPFASHRTATTVQEDGQADLGRKQ